MWFISLKQSLNLTLRLKGFKVIEGLGWNYYYLSVACVLKCPLIAADTPKTNDVIYEPTLKHNLTSIVSRPYAIKGLGQNCYLSFEVLPDCRRWCWWWGRAACARHSAPTAAPWSSDLREIKHGYSLELQTSLREDFTITEKGTASDPISYRIVWCWQPNAAEDLARCHYTFLKFIFRSLTSVHDGLISSPEDCRKDVSTSLLCDCENFAEVPCTAILQSSYSNKVNLGAWNK